MVSRLLLGAARSERLESLAVGTPFTRSLVARFVAGEDESDAVAVAARLRDSGLLVTVDRLGEDTLDEGQSTRTTDAYLRLLTDLSEAGLSAAAEVSVKLSAVGQALPADGEKIAADNAARICERAAAVGTTVTLDMEDHTTTDSTLGILAGCGPTSHRRVRCCRRTCAAPRATAGTCPGGLPGPAVQGRLRRAGVRRVPEPRRGRRAYVRA